MTPDHHLLASAPDIPSRWLQSYQAHLSRTWTPPSGQSLCVRPVRHDDSELEEACPARGVPRGVSRDGLSSLP